jgi:uncharacterized protein YndB with AHSA1/START domain
MTSETDRTVTVARTIAAPPASVFRAWTDPAELGWFLNPDQPTPSEPIEVDLRVGGTWRLMMVVNEDLRYVTGGIYREIVPNERLAFVWGAVDGWPKLDADNLDDGILTTVTFVPAGAGTEMVLSSVIPAHYSAERVEEWLTSGMREGWGMTLDRVVAKFA